MTGEETVTYKGIPTCEIQKQLELQRWILDPSSIPYENRDSKLIARSAAAAEGTKKSNVEKQLELQRMIIADYP